MAQSTVKLIVDAQNAISPLKRVNEQTKALSSSTDKLKGRLNKSNRSIRESGRAARSASGGFRSLTNSLGPLLKILAVIGTARFVIFQTAQLETQTKALEVLTGSATKAKNIVQEIKEFGAVTPFKSSQLIEVTKRLKAFGFETENVVDITKRVADIAGTAGADIDNVALAIGKVQAKNKFMQEENVMLLEKGINVTKELEKITGMTGEELAKAMSKGEIGANLFRQAIINLTSEGGEFFKGASKQSDTLAGKFSTLIDRVETLAQLIGTQLKPGLKGALDIAIKGVNAIEKIFSRFMDIGDVGLGNFAKAEQDAQRDAARLTATRFGTDFKGESVFASKEENKFFKKQFELLKKQNIEREKLRQKSFEEITIVEQVNQKHNQGTKEITKKNDEIKKVNENLDKTKTAADQLKAKFMEIGESVEQGIVSNLTDAVMGTRTLAQAAIGVLNDLKRKLVEVAIQQAVSGIGGKIGGFLGNIFGKRANGGPVSSGGAYLVGERGPEILQMGSRGGNIIPNNAIGGGGTTNMITVNVDATGSSVAGNGSEADQLGGLIASVVQATIIDEQRAGGLLNR